MRSQDAACLAGSGDRIKGCRDAGCLDDDLALIRVQRIEIAWPEVQSYFGIILNTVNQVLGKISDTLLIRNRKQLVRPFFPQEFIGGLSFRAKTQNQDGFLANFIQRQWT